MPAVRISAHEVRVGDFLQHNGDLPEMQWIEVTEVSPLGESGVLIGCGGFSFTKTADEPVVVSRGN